MFEVNWQSRFNYPLDLERSMAEIWLLASIKTQQIIDSKKRRGSR